MKAAIVKQRRTLADGRRLVNVVCPVCDGRHWLSDNHTGQCPRLRSKPAFTITERNTHR